MPFGSARRAYMPLGGVALYFCAMLLLRYVMHEASEISQMNHPETERTRPTTRSSYLTSDARHLGLSLV